jgi:hypothetical protein
MMNTVEEIDSHYAKTGGKSADYINLKHNVSCIFSTYNSTSLMGT